MRYLLLSALIATGIALGGANTFGEEQPQDAQTENQGQNSQEYVVKEGDSLSKISKELFGSEAGWQSIAAANNLANPDQIFVGQKLVIPSKPANISSATDETMKAPDEPSLTNSVTVASEEQVKAPIVEVASAEVGSAETGSIEVASSETAEKTEQHGEHATNSEIMGEVTKVAAESLHVKDDAGKTHSVQVSDIKIMENIKVGDDVKVTLAKGKAISIEKVEASKS